MPNPLHVEAAMDHLFVQPSLPLPRVQRHIQSIMLQVSHLERKGDSSKSIPTLHTHIDGIVCSL
ncbi:hypothetical protein D3C74_412070 [compost metagenome]